ELRVHVVVERVVLLGIVVDDRRDRAVDLDSNCAAHRGLNIGCAPTDSPRSSPTMTNAPMGHGVNQRDLIKMTPEEVDAFLAERRSMTMSTISGDGSIHSIAMWYGFLEGAVAFETKAKAQKVVNLRRDPRLTCLVEAGETYDQLRGVTLIGRGEIVDEPDRIWELGVSVFERYNAPYT